MLVVLLCAVLSLAASVHSIEGALRYRSSANDGAAEVNSKEALSASAVDRNDEWTAFKLKYNKMFETEKEEEVPRLIFFKTLAEIELHNYQESIGLTTFKMGINEFSDIDHSEFVRQRNGFKGRKTSGVSSRGEASFFQPRAHLLEDAPATVDWRNKGYVTPVKNQGACGSCWSFSSTGALEGQLKRKTGKLVSLSEQNLVDCSKPYGNDGCGGGWMDIAYLYVDLNDGIDTESSYPYTGQDGDCVYNVSTIGGNDFGFYRLPMGNETNLQEFVAEFGPIAVAIDASLPSFQSYHSGVYNDPTCDPSALDHAVLVVGYGTDKATGLDYWLVKNSWGVGWGDSGYIKMSRNRKNQCGIASHAILPLV